MFVSEILEKLALSPRSAHQSPDLYLFCTTKVFPKFLLPFQSQASFQSEQFGSYDYAPRSLSLVACSLSEVSGRACSCKKDPGSLKGQFFSRNTYCNISKTQGRGFIYSPLYHGGGMTLRVRPRVKTIV